MTHVDVDIWRLKSKFAITLIWELKYRLPVIFEDYLNADSPNLKSMQIISEWSRLGRKGAEEQGALLCHTQCKSCCFCTCK